AGSASGRSLSGSGPAVEPSVVATGAGTYVAWADGRNGNFEIYVAHHTTAGWHGLAGSAEGGGVSATRGSSRLPSLTLDAQGRPLVAWTEPTAGGTDIFVARFDPAANAGQGAWVALGSSLSGGISGTGAADQAVVIDTTGGPVVAWLDRTGGAV